MENKVNENSIKIQLPVGLDMDFKPFPVWSM